jgi:hypothetical protein
VDRNTCQPSSGTGDCFCHQPVSARRFWFGDIAIAVIGALAAAVHGRVGQGAAHGDGNVSDGLWDDRTMS